MKKRECDHWPEVFKQHLITQPADIFEDDEPFIFIDADHLEAERQAIVNALPYPAESYKSRYSPEESIGLAANFYQITRFGEPPPAAALAEKLAHFQQKKSTELHCRLYLAHRAIDHARHTYGNDYDPTRLFAVNHRWDRRWESILCGDLYPAYLGYFQLDQF